MNYPVTLKKKDELVSEVVADLEVCVSDYPYYINTTHELLHNGLTITIKYNSNTENHFIRSIDEWSFNIGSRSGRIYSCEINPFSQNTQLPELRTIIHCSGADKKEYRFQHNLEFGFKIISKVLKFEQDNEYINRT